MFTGIIEGLGTVREARTGQGVSLTVQADFELADARIGDSIAVSGACLTVVRLSGKIFTADVSPETCEKTSLGRARPGDRVNLERALTLSGRLDGHLVTGHVDGLGAVKSIRTEENALVFTFSAPPELTRLMVAKGSVAVDGVSLTINTCDENGFSVSVIPHTARITSLGGKKPGDPVNLETDVIGKYVEKFLLNAPAKKAPEHGSQAIDMEFLAKKGFL